MWPLLLLAMAAGLGAQANDPERQVQRAQELLAAGQLDEAIAIYRDLLRTGAGNSSLLLNLCIAEYKAKHFSAFDPASMGVNRNPQSSRGFYAGAKALEQLGKLELALNWVQRAASLEPQSAATWYLMARLLQKLGQDNLAEQATPLLCRCESEGTFSTKVSDD